MMNKRHVSIFVLAVSIVSSGLAASAPAPEEQSAEFCQTLPYEPLPYPDEIEVVEKPATATQRRDRDTLDRRASSAAMRDRIAARFTKPIQRQQKKSATEELPGWLDEHPYLKELVEERIAEEQAFDDLAEDFSAASLGSRDAVVSPEKK